MHTPVIALFGEAEKGQLEMAHYCRDLEQLFELLGEPPKETLGLFFAIQSLLYGQPLLYFRVREEGVSLKDYEYGLHLLHDDSFEPFHLQALFLPGVGSKDLIEEGWKLCKARRSVLIMNEKDLYDYL